MSTNRRSLTVACLVIFAALVSVVASGVALATPPRSNRPNGGKSTYIRSHTTKGGNQVGGHYEQRGNWGKPKSSGASKSRSK